MSVDFDLINRVAARSLPCIVARWLPDGRRVGNEWSSRNPLRADRHPGSFKVNIVTGKWADFATGACGGDVISLAAYLFNKSQFEAARGLGRMLGIDLRG